MTARLEALTRRFLERCAVDQCVLHRQLCGAGAVSLTDLATIVHQMAGAAGAFGFLQLSGLAQRLEQDLSTGKPPSREHVQKLIDELGRLEVGVSGGGSA